MREILFRGKRTGNEKWICGHLLEQNIPDCHSYIVMSIIAELDNRHIEIMDFDINEVIPETVGQYTGLTDKNGVKIFEGDIVKGIAYSVERIGVIVWIDEIASFGVRYFKSVNSTTWENSSILRCASMGKTDEFAAEIIGNIHDNPEILKGGGDNA